MPHPTVCRNPDCPNHASPPGSWYRLHGHYHTKAFGPVRRYRCKNCRRTVSHQTESTHYYSKQPLPLSRLSRELSGRSMRDVAREFGVSSAVIRNNVLRLGRQCMAAQIHLLDQMKARKTVAFDGLRSFVTSQDYPCDITTVVDSDSQSILTMVHSIFRRGGNRTASQTTRIARKYAQWTPASRSMTRDISLLTKEMIGYLDLTGDAPAVVHTDRHLIYYRVLQKGAAGACQRRGVLRHQRTSSLLPRTTENPLFPVNYVDRLLRHREKEHTRETIAFGRHAVVQMHRAWIWAWDHNMQREYRVVKPELGTHVERGVMEKAGIRRIFRELWGRRLSVRGKEVPETIRTVWCGALQTPPVRWRKGVARERWKMRIPNYCIEDIREGERAESSWG